MFCEKTSGFRNHVFSTGYTRHSGCRDIMFLRKLFFPEKTAIFCENQAFRGFRGLVGQREKHVKKMCRAENFTLASPNNFYFWSFHETQNKNLENLYCKISDCEIFEKFHENFRNRDRKFLTSKKYIFRSDFLMKIDIFTNRFRN